MISKIFPFNPLVSNPKSIKACSKLESGIAMVVVLLQSVLKILSPRYVIIGSDNIASVFMHVKSGVLLIKSPITLTLFPFLISREDSDVLFWTLIWIRSGLFERSKLVMAGLS